MPSHRFLSYKIGTDPAGCGPSPNQQFNAGRFTMKLAFAYVTDEGGLELATHSAMSLALSQPGPCDIHIFCYEFSPKLSPQLSLTLARLRANLAFHEIGDATLERHETCGHVTTPSLLKLPAIGKLVGQYDRIVYLDNDILVFDHLKIEDIEFGRAPVAAVIDMDLSHTGALRHSKWSSAGGRAGKLGAYFNAGFMVFECSNWRNDEFYEAYAAALDQHDIGCTYKINCTSIEQCALNTVFKKNWIRLPASYNMQAGAKFTPSWKTALVRHYCGTRKFMPISLFRSDSRDVRHLNRIRQAMGKTTTPLPFMYEILFHLNAARKYRSDSPMRRFLSGGLAQSP
jgi:lipopolysaccharide biosynthesis glycosyltransferase